MPRSRQTDISPANRASPAHVIRPLTERLEEARALWPFGTLRLSFNFCLKRVTQAISRVKREEKEYVL